MASTQRRVVRFTISLMCIAVLTGGVAYAVSTAYYLYDDSGNRVAIIDGAALAPHPAASAGAVFMFGGLNCPTGSLPADGRALGRTTYTALFNAIGTLHGAGDGSTTFNLPDLRGEFVRGLDGGRGVDVGRTVGSPQGDGVGKAQVPISTTNYVHGAAPVYLSSKTKLAAGWASSSSSDSWEGWGPIGSVTARTQANVSMGTPETRPRNVALLFCIQH
jgi:microcystin-dependent protein